MLFLVGGRWKDNFKFDVSILSQFVLQEKWRSRIPVGLGVTVPTRFRTPVGLGVTVPTRPRDPNFENKGMQDKKNSFQCVHNENEKEILLL